MKPPEHDTTERVYEHEAVEKAAEDDTTGRVLSGLPTAGLTSREPEPQKSARVSKC